MFRNLTNIEIIEAESIFLAIDWKCISPEKAEQVMINMKHRSFEQYVYLEWLLLRWRLFRKDHKHLPAKLQLTV